MNPNDEATITAMWNRRAVLAAAIRADTTSSQDWADYDAAVRAEAEADALNSAADDLYSNNGPGNMLSTMTWLRARAAGSVPVDAKAES